MKLLFDNNISVLLPPQVSAFFPSSKHVSELKLDHFSDREIWHYAKENDFTIVTKDKDFYHLANSLGHPPKLVWLTIGNCSNRQLIELVLNNSKGIALFIKGNKSILVLP